MAGTVRKVPEGLGGKRLDEVLERLFDAGSKARAAALVKRGRVTVDGKRVWREDARVASGARVAVSGSARAGEAVGPAPALVFLHVDDALVVVDKPAGMVVQPNPKQPRGTVANALLARFGALEGAPKGERAGLVHRLDRETSGVLAAARTRAAQEFLVGEFRERRVEKRYLALVHGVPRPDAFDVDLPLGAHPVHADVQRHDPKGQPASTAFRVLERFPAAGDGEGRAWVACEPHTGRRHQIRVHLAEAGHPIVGDKIYRPVGRASASREIGRHALHAAALGFFHPTTGERRRFEAPLPPDMAQLVASWRGSPPPE